MRKFWEKVQHYNTKLIPIAIFVLLFIIIFELFLHIENHILELIIQISDYFVLAVFVIDIIFLAIHSKSIKFFFKNYWLDLLAIIPIVLVFTIVSYIYRAAIATSRLAIGQSILHESLETKKIIFAAGREGKIVSSSSRVAKYLRIITRGIRVVAKSRLFTKFKAKHHLARRKFKHIKKNKTNQRN